MTTNNTDIDERVASLLRDGSVRTSVERGSYAQPDAIRPDEAGTPVGGAGDRISEVLEFFDQVRRELQTITETLNQFVRGGTPQPATPVRRPVDDEHPASDDATDGARRLARLREQLAETLSTSAQSAGGRAGATVVEPVAATATAEPSKSLLTELYDGGLR